MLPLREYVRLVPDSTRFRHADPDSRVRFASSDDVDAYFTESINGDPAHVELLTPAEALREDAMLGLRMSEGIPASLADRAGVTAVLDHLAERGLVLLRDGRWRPTERGWLLGNEVFSAVWCASPE
jgi:oxygen-independent coproporphyrinogen-3 oxidase